MCIYPDCRSRYVIIVYILSFHKDLFYVCDLAYTYQAIICKEKGNYFI